MKGKQGRKILGSLQSLPINIVPVKDSSPLYTRNLCPNNYILRLFSSSFLSFIPFLYFYYFLFRVYFCFISSLQCLWFTALFVYFSLSLTLSTDSSRLLFLLRSIHFMFCVASSFLPSLFFILSTFSRKCVFLIFPSLLFPHPSSNSLPTVSTLHLPSLSLSPKGIKISVLVGKEKNNIKSEK